jgi:hypothetical protein
MAGPGFEVVGSSLVPVRCRGCGAAAMRPVVNGRLVLPPTNDTATTLPGPGADQVQVAVAVTDVTVALVCDACGRQQSEQ